MSNNRFNCCGVGFMTPKGLAIAGGSPNPYSPNHNESVWYNGPRLNFYRTKAIGCYRCEDTGVHGSLHNISRSTPVPFSKADLTSLNFFPVPPGATASEIWKYPFTPAGWSGISYGSLDTAIRQLKGLSFAEILYYQKGADGKGETLSYIPKICDCFTNMLYPSSTKSGFQNHIATSLQTMCTNYGVGANLWNVEFEPAEHVTEYNTTLTRADGLTLGPGQLATDYWKTNKQHADFFQTLEYNRTFVIPKSFLKSGGFVAPLTNYKLIDLANWQLRKLPAQDYETDAFWNNSKALAVRFLIILSRGLLYQQFGLLGLTSSSNKTLFGVESELKNLGSSSFLTNYYFSQALQSRSPTFPVYDILESIPEFLGPNIKPACGKACNVICSNSPDNSGCCSSGVSGASGLTAHYSVHNAYDEPEKWKWLYSPNVIPSLSDDIYKKNQNNKHLLYWTVNKDIIPEDRSDCYDTNPFIPEGVEVEKDCGYNGTSCTCQCKSTSYSTGSHKIKCNYFKGPHTYYLSSVDIIPTGDRYYNFPNSTFLGNSVVFQIDTIIPKSYMDPKPTDPQPCTTTVNSCDSCTSRFGGNWLYTTSYPTLGNMKLTDLDVFKGKTLPSYVGIACNKYPGSSCAPIGSAIGYKRECVNFTKASAGYFCKARFQLKTVCQCLDPYGYGGCPDICNEDITREWNDFRAFDPNTCKCPDGETIITGPYTYGAGGQGVITCKDCMTTRRLTYEKVAYCDEYPDDQLCTRDTTCLDKCGNQVSCCPSETHEVCKTEDGTEWIYNPGLFYTEDPDRFDYIKMASKVGKDLYAYTNSKCLHGISADCWTETFCDSQNSINDVQFMKSFSTKLFGVNAEFGSLLNGYPNATNLGNLVGMGPGVKSPVGDLGDVLNQFGLLLQTRKSKHPPIADKNYWTKRTLYELVDTFSISTLPGITTDYYPNGLPSLEFSNKLLVINGANGSVYMSDAKEKYRLNYFTPNPYGGMYYANY